MFLKFHVVIRMYAHLFFQRLTTLPSQIFVEKTQSLSKTAPLSRELRYYTQENLMAFTIQKFLKSSRARFRILFAI